MRSSVRLLSFLFCVAFLGTTAHAQKVCHLILVGDTNDPKIGQSVEKDLATVNQLFMSNVAENQLAITRMSGDQVSEDNIIGTVRNVLNQMATEDTIILYYSGHGAFTEGSGQYLQLPGGVSLYRNTLLGVFQERDVRLKVLLTDTCSVVISQAPKLAYAAIQPPETTSPAFASLCWKPTGLVDISASSKGEVAMGSNAVGGYFTHNLSQFLYQNADQQVEWSSLINTVRQRTGEYFRQQHPNGVANPFLGRSQTTQTVEGRFQPSSSGTVPPPSPDGPRFGVLAVSDPRGVVVREVVPNSPATRIFFSSINQTVALEAGDIITHINGVLVEGESGYGALIDASPRSMSLRVLNVRDGQSYDGTVELAR